MQYVKKICPSHHYRHWVGMPCPICELEKEAMCPKCKSDGEVVIEHDVTFEVRQRVTHEVDHWRLTCTYCNVESRPCFRVSEIERLTDWLE